MADVDRSEYAQGLRDLADFLERSNAPLPSTSIATHCFEREEFVRAARAMGYAPKDYFGNYASVTKEFGPLALIYQTDREKVCRRVVVGTEQVAVEEQDPIALEAVPKIKRIETREKVEWQCEPLLADREAA